MARQPFLASLAFGAVAALGVVPFCLAAGPLFGRSWAVAVFAALAVPLYLMTIARSWPQRLAVGVLAALATFGLGLFVSRPQAAVAGCALVLGVARSVFLHRRRPARGVLLEAALLVGGLVAARLLLGPSLLDVGLACFGFFLIQSLFFLVGGGQEPKRQSIEGDPFDRAREAASALLRDLE